MNASECGNGKLEAVKRQERGLCEGCGNIEGECVGDEWGQMSVSFFPSFPHMLDSALPDPLSSA